LAIAEVCIAALDKQQVWRSAFNMEILIMNLKIAHFVLLAMLGLTLTAAAPALAHDFKAGELTIDHPWAKPSIGNAPNSAAYMTIMNAGSAGDHLESAASPVANKVELHTHIMDGNIMRMRQVEGGVSVDGKGAAKFEPGGLHVMLFGLKQTLKEGDTFPMTLTFRKAGNVMVEVKVEKGKTGGEHKHSH